MAEWSVLSVVAAALAGLALYLFWFTTRHYWKVRGVPYLQPVLPLLGNIYDVLLMKPFPDIWQRIYDQTGGVPYIGVYAFHTPVLFVRDLDLISRILIKDFKHFEDRGFHSNASDPLARNLIHQMGDDWKFSRSKLAPTLTIAKVKTMFHTMQKKSEVLVQELKGKVEMWDVSLRYSVDVITLHTFGVQADSLRQQDDHFRAIGHHLLQGYFIYHVLVGCFFPWLHRLLRTPVAPAKVFGFFKDVVQQVLHFRKDQIHDHQDLVQTMMQLRDTSLKADDKQKPEVDENFIVAQAFSFFMAGYETTGTTLACALYEVAKQPSIQETLYTEITQVLDKHGGQVTYEAVQDMKYLRQVVSEALRKYAPLPLIFRRCTQDYQLPGTETVVERGTLVLIPLRCIHDDPEFYPNASGFDPEHFSEQNCADRHIATNLSFGIGPRMCPAVLYSHVAVKTAMVYILKDLEVQFTEETPSNLQPDPKHFLMTPKGGVPIAFKKRIT